MLIMMKSWATEVAGICNRAIYTHLFRQRQGSSRGPYRVGDSFLEFTAGVGSGMMRAWFLVQFCYDPYFHHEIKPP